MSYFSQLTAALTDFMTIKLGWYTVTKQAQNALEADDPPGPSELSQSLGSLEVEEYGMLKVSELEAILQDDTRRDALVHSHDSDAQDVLDLCHWILAVWERAGAFKDDNNRWTNLRWRVYRVAVRLIQNSELLPQKIYLHKDSLEFILNEHRFVERIGFGGYADVYKGHLGGDELVAVKVFRKDLSLAVRRNDDAARDIVLKRDSEDDLKYKHITREIALQRYLEHPHICRPKGVVLDKSADKPICFVYPLMENGNVMDYLNGATTEVTVSPLSQIFLEIATALAYIHKEKVVHGDLHTRNILIDAKGHVQITDFGMANFVDSTENSVSLARHGAERYMAPEILQSAERRSKTDGVLIVHTEQSDIFSAGMCMLEIFTNSPPFGHNISPRRAVNLIASGEIPERPPNMDDTLWNILRDCWKNQATDRPCARELVDRLQTWEAT